MNILLTSVGRRAYMVKYFKEAVGKEGQVHVCNSDDKSVAFLYADKSFVSPMIYSDDYIPCLLSYCQKEKIDVLISLFDIDLYVLACNKEKFSQIGTKVIVSNKEIIEICNDKWKTYCFLTKNGFCSPKTYLTLKDALCALDNKELRFPVVVKPRFGCGSIAVSFAYSKDDLRYLSRVQTEKIADSYLKYESATVAKAEWLIYQEVLQGQEYGADIINDLIGNYKNVIVRKKIAMRSGETDIAEIVCEPLLSIELERLGSCTSHIGNMDCDVFLVNNKPYILEMNARFGGGYPFSYISGCNLPKAIVSWCDGKEVNQNLLNAKIGVLAYKELVLTSTDAAKFNI